MDSAIDLPSQAPVEGDNWNVYRDAFALPRDTRRPKPWERASVPAHAPRLQGQKIWKRAGIQIRDNKENEEALFELQSEGNGARKRRKLWAVKESIKDAPWKRGLSSTESPDHGQNNVELGGEDIVAIRGRDDSYDDALRSIPRKRTNTDHVITPKKPLRQMHLNGQSRTLQVRPDETFVDNPERRRRSKRNSIRKSTSPKLAERAISNSSPGPASVLETYTETIQSDVTTQETPKTVPEMTLVHPTSAGDSENMEDGDREEASTVKVTNVERGRRRAISPKYTRRSTRNSMYMSSRLEDAAPQCNSTAEAVEIQSVSHVATQDPLNTGISGEVVAQAANDISITRAEEIQNEVQLGEEAVQSEAPVADYLKEPLIHQLDKHVQPTTQQGESLESLPLVESTPTTQEIPVQQNHEAELEQVQTTEPCAAEVGAITSPIDLMGEEASETPQTEPAKHVETPSCPPVDKASAEAFHTSSPINATVQMLHPQTEDQLQELFEDLGRNIQPDSGDSLTSDTITSAEESSPGGHSTSPKPPNEPVEAPPGSYDDDDTDMLRKFLTRVKADKAAKAETATPGRKRSQPHSPLRIPLGDIDANTSPPPPDPSEGCDISLAPSPAKRRKRGKSTIDSAEPKTIRRSGRTRLTKIPPAAPSLIPVRRMGQDGDTTVTLRRNEEKELTALTEVNTGKNKEGALPPSEVLMLKAAEKTDPVLKQKLLKEMYEDKKRAKQSEKPKSVKWSTELTQFQSEGGGKDKVKDNRDMGSSSEETKKEKKKGAGGAASSLNNVMMVPGFAPRVMENPLWPPVSNITVQPFNRRTVYKRTRRGNFGHK